jgi:Janus/Ocnus family (Ocnus)
MFTFIDYSETYYKDIAKRKVPSRRSGKFVQIVNHSTNDEYLVLSPKELSLFHAMIVERFFRLKGNITGSYNEKKDFYTVLDPDWEVIGGGMWAIDSRKKTLSMSGESQAYGRFSDTDLKEKVKAREGMASLTIVIDGI